MLNRYPGKCADCGGPVAAKAGTLEKIGRRWLVRHLACSEGEHVSVFNIGGREFIQNSRGRCEDAPCCGCCTI